MNCFHEHTSCRLLFRRKTVSNWCGFLSSHLLCTKVNSKQSISKLKTHNSGHVCPIVKIPIVFKAPNCSYKMVIILFSDVRIDSVVSITGDF